MQIDLDFKLQNRAEASIKFLDILSKDMFEEGDWVICALSFDAVPMANILSQRLGLKYDILFVESIFTPNNEECMIASVSEKEEIVIQEELRESFDIPKDYIYEKLHRVYEEEIVKKIERFRNGEDLVSIKDKNILFIDDTCENDLITLGGIKTAIGLKAKKIAYLCAVISKDIEKKFEEEIDELFYLYSANNYIDNQHYYVEKLKKLKDEDVFAILQNSENFIHDIDGSDKKKENI